ncbi:lipase gdsl protein [Diplodia corticola]|uniref:Lipase gdsl protein n=1 Tax=Diplodia corticola TaxID=236234 RepID=A0A1J9S5Z8_9PEZI|nr:lipase gdsl protein [Diplodia corticola]OJD35943.1 lipase gdsl protein [Diplodia corticola]
MRTITRFHVLVFCAVCTVVYIGWVLPSLQVQSRVQKAFSGSQRRLVVFGDSWSDVGTYHVDIPALNPQHNVSRPLWTQALCKELLCDDINNFARSSGAANFIDHPDAVLDTDILANVTNQHPEDQKFLADLKKQVQQWISFEKQSGLISRRAQRKEWTVFTVFFGISDIWQYTFQDNKARDDDITETIAALFAQLDVIAQHTQTRPHIVLPKVIDISFLPAFARQPLEFPDRQQSAVSLTATWNNALEKAAREWTGGYIHLLPTDKWLLKLIREQQMHKIGITDERGEGKGNPRFSEVRSPCVPLPRVGAQFPFDMDDASSNRTEPCEDESHYLFWDGMHLSGRAHKLLAIEAADLVATNYTFNLNALRKHDLEREEAAHRATPENETGPTESPQ